MILLNGADGMSDMFAKALTLGGTGLGLARQLLSTMNQDGGRGGGRSAGQSAVGGAVNSMVPPAPHTEKIPVADEPKD
ncbi:hypothetical protein ACFWDI_30320 [Streptomyces sp. NPDC060064]|uniref:hypothetical protein n=1 Tax=Streptomyces sp. NPDC060064 TaxID=3347049 RepID=UPI0036BAAB8F